MKQMILLLLCWLPGAAGAQENQHPVRLLPLMNGAGLSSHRITSIVQDQQGYIWFGTEDGLNRYNGQSVKVFRHVPGDSLSLSANSISRMLVDRTGRLWIGTTGSGLNCYDPVRGVFKVYRHQAGDSRSLPNDDVHFLLESRNGNIWIGADFGGGLIKYDPVRNTFTRYLSPPGATDSGEEVKRSNSVLSIVEDRDGTFWLGTRNGLFHFNPQTKLFDGVYRHPGAGQSKFENLITVIYPDGNDTLWLGCWGGGLKSFNKRTGKYRDFRYAPLRKPNGEQNLVISILGKSNRELWVSTLDQGLAVFDKSTGRFAFVDGDPFNPRNQYPVQTSYLYRDRTGILWVGTLEGVRYINPYAKAFKFIPLPPATGAGVRNTAVVGRIWGQQLYAGAGASTGLYVRPAGNAPWRVYPLSPLPHDVRNIVRDRSGQFWISTSVGLFRFDTIANRFTPFTAPAALVPFPKDIQYDNLLADRRGDVWIGTRAHGLFRYRPKNAAGRGDTLIYYPPHAKGPAGEAISDLLEDQDGSIWVATSSGGLSCYDPRRDQFTHYTHDPGNPASLPFQKLSGLAQDNAGDLWMGTPGGGLCRLSGLRTGKAHFTRYTVDDGLPTNRIFRLARDRRGRIWMGTAKGLSCFQPGQYPVRFFNFDTHDGLAQDQLNSGLTVAETGHLLIGGTGRVAVFHPDSLLAPRPVPPVMIGALSVFDREARFDSLIDVKATVELAHDENFFTLSFAALQYVNPDRNRYRYMLEGYDDRWNNAGNRGYATYTKVPPGNYRFRVRASGNFGGGEQEKTIRLVILPPWWMTWWARAGYGLLALVVLLLIRREVVKRARLQTDLRAQRMEASKWQEIDAMKSRFFANISHELRTPLTLIINTTDDLLREEKKGGGHRTDHALIRSSAGRLLKLINQLLLLAKLEAGKLQLAPTPGNLTECLRTTLRSFASLAESRGISYLLHLPEQEYRALFDQHKLDEILGNLLSNALKFTPPGGSVEVTVTVEPLPDHPAYRLSVAVADSGMGIAPEHLPRVFDRFYQADGLAAGAHEGTGLGLSLVKELAELHGGEITVESAPGRGTVFRVALTLPVAPAAARDAAPPQEAAAPGAHPEERASAASCETAGPAAGLNGEDRTKVLVVEDDADLRRYIGKHLRKKYTVLEAENGAGGWQIAHEQLPDLVITDLMMPESDGLTLCKRVKEHPHTAHIPVVMLTARSGQEDRIGGLELGANDYLTKPFDVRELLLRVQNLLDTQKQQREQAQREFYRQPEKVAASSSLDNQFCARVQEAIQRNLHRPAFGVEQLAAAMNMTVSTLHRKLRALLDIPPGDMIREYRLLRAAELLGLKTGKTIGEISDEVGFKDATTFTRAFTKKFGCAPSVYAKKHAA